MSKRQKKIGVKPAIRPIVVWLAWRIRARQIEIKFENPLIRKRLSAKTASLLIDVLKN
jgi:hypothetical protein